jgi:anti-sigma B factor antagonist
MKSESHTVEGVLVIKPKGKITIGEGDVKLREAVLEALESGALKLVINLGGVSSMDSSGVGEMVSAYTTVTNRGGRLSLAELPSKISDILQITQLIQVFDVFDTEKEAIDQLA